MADVLRDAIDVAIADIDKEIGDPEDPLYYGRDVWCQFDVTPGWDTLAADDPKIVTNAVLRRLITERGSLLDDPDYGLDLRKRWHQAMSRQKREALALEIVAEARKDDRVERAIVNVEKLVGSDLQGLLASISLELKDIDGVFNLTFRISDRGLELV